MGGSSTRAGARVVIEQRVLANLTTLRDRFRVAPTGKMTFALHVVHVYVGSKKPAEILEAAGHCKP